MVHRAQNIYYLALYGKRLPTPTLVCYSSVFSTFTGDKNNLGYFLNLQLLRPPPSPGDSDSVSLNETQEFVSLASTWTFEKHGFSYFTLPFSCISFFYVHQVHTLFFGFFLISLHECKVQTSVLCDIVLGRICQKQGVWHEFGCMLFIEGASQEQRSYGSKIV